ncbi:MAG: hypothetical protein IPJ19_16325 [Planctomycetes bacterium]|nr:hypothetical protein [Planctomycetota bacterium]
MRVRSPARLGCAQFMRAGAQALLPFFLACIAFVLIATVWESAGGGFTSRAGGPKAHVAARAAGGGAGSQTPEPAEQVLVRGRLVDARSGEPVCAPVTLFGAHGFERHAEAGADGIFQVGCPREARLTLAVPRTDTHFGRLKELVARAPFAPLVLSLEPRRDLPVVLRTRDGRALEKVAPPSGEWARETWPTLLITESPPIGRPSEGAPDPLLATRLGRFLSTVHGDVPLRPGSPTCCVGYVRLFQAPPVVCSLVIGSRVLQSVQLEGDERLISFQVDPSELENTHADAELHVIDSETSLPPLARHGVWLGMLGARAHELDAELDHNGRFELEGVAAGSAELELRLSGYENQTRRVDLHAGERNDLGVVRVHPGACVAGHIVSESGEPVHARVWSSSRDGRDRPAGQPVDSPPGADWFAICGLPRTSVLVGLEDPRYALNPVELDLSEGSAQNARIVARRGTLLRLEGPYSAGGAASVRVLDARHLCIWLSDNLEQEVHDLALLPGHYTIEVQHAGGRALRQELDLASGAGATILLR